MDVQNNAEVVETVDTGLPADQLVDDNAGNRAAPADKTGEIADDAGNKADDWKPNYKIKSYDKEFEIPETFRGFINKENEKNFRETFEKAFALDEMKNKNSKIRERNEQVEQILQKEHMPLKQKFDNYGKYIKNKDYDTLFTEAGIPEEDLKAWMLQKLQMKQLPPEQQALYNQSRAAQQKLYQLEQENSSYKEKYDDLTKTQQQQTVNDRLSELDRTVNSPEIQAAAQAFDSRLGQDGSFKIEVLKRAILMAQTSGVEPTVEQAVKETLRVLGISGQQAQQIVDAAQPQAGEKKPTLPSLTGKATSPVSQKVKSIDDLKRLRTLAMKEQRSQNS